MSARVFRLTGDFFLLVVIVTGREELPKDESRYVNLLHFVLHHRDTFSIIPNTDGVVFTEIAKQTYLFSLEWPQKQTKLCIRIFYNT